MRVALIHDAVLPAPTYGGTERVVWWLAKGLASKKIPVTLIARPGSEFPFGDFKPHDFSQPVSFNADILHFFATPPQIPKQPYLVTIGGNGKAGEKFVRNTVFVSENHAHRHHATAFVHNGVDPDDYQFSEIKGRSLLFLAKASWKVKNVKGAIRIARESSSPLNIIGGSRPWLPKWRGTRWCGMLGGVEKARYLAESKGLLFPVIWDEPFGLAVVEALISGTPVLASRRGSLPELIPDDCGALCDSYAEFVERVLSLGQFCPQHCRDWALSQFSFEKMTEKYLQMYERIASGETLNEGEPFMDETQGLSKELGFPDK